MSNKRATEILKKLYPEITKTQIHTFISTYLHSEKQPKISIIQNDSILITYPDHIKKNNQDHLKTLTQFVKKIPINSVHVLPIHPYSSDEGYSVTDYTKIKKNLGDWKDIRNISYEKNLMLDFVANHTSAKHQLFKEFIEDKNKSYISFDKKINTDKVFRPRTTPLLNKFEDKYVWTTFSKDQIDINYKDFETFQYMCTVLINYITKGAKYIRIDAAAYLWKDPNTSSINLPQTHLLIELFSTIANHHGAKIITETNLPQKENLSYFNDKVNEVYNFTFAPLVLYTLLKEDATFFAKWSKTVPKDKILINFTASHDGIGLTPLQGILPQKEINWLITQIKKRGGKVSNRKKGNKKIPYEANITLTSLLENKFLASQAITLFSKGIPAIYMGSLLGATNNSKTKNNRDINRERFTLTKAEKMIKSNQSQALLELIKNRNTNKDFNPKVQQNITFANKELTIKRRTTKVSIDLETGAVRIE